jgi:hypothetical protein
MRNDAVVKPPQVVKPQMVKRFVFGSGEMIAAKVYGTIVVLAVIAAGGKAFQDRLWRLVTLVVATVLVIWLSHVYAYGLARSVESGKRITVSELARIAKRELALPLVAVVPTAVLVLGAIGLLGPRSAVLSALAVGVAILAVQGFRYARAERLGPVGTVAAVTLNVALGLALVFLEVLVA